MDVAEGSRTLEEYVGALEDERRKIQMFQRELPLCLQLVTQTIESLQPLTQAEASAAMDASKMAPPVLEEFLPLKPSLSLPSNEEEEEEDEHEGNENKTENKPDWLKSVQLWSQHPEKTTMPGKAAAVKKSGNGAFQPFEREKRTGTTSSSAEVASGNSSKKNKTNEEKENEKEALSSQLPQRKSRRCWSPELHRRFLTALQQLGGSHVATPKQIRELMNVDGLTNDEVKSHLQKYRLHTRRPNPGIQSNSGGQQTPQFVVVGGIWVQPPAYAAAAAAANTLAEESTPAAIHGVYTPPASIPSDSNLKTNKRIMRSPTSPLNSPGRGSNEDKGAGMNSASPATSSASSQTTTASPLL